MQRKTFLCAVGATSILALSGPALAAEGCDTLLPEQQGAAARGPVTAEILARLRDAGPIYHYQTDHPILSLSPDKSSVAFEIHRGDPTDDSYCVGIVVLPINRGTKPYLVDVGRELILDPHSSKGFAAFQSGVPLPITPRWGPDGRWLAFLKRAGGSTQVWSADLATRRARQITRSASDVDDFRIGPDRQTIIYAARPRLIANEAAIDREGRSGWHLDARMLPLRGARPQTPNVDTRYFAIDTATGAERSALPAEAALFRQPGEVSETASARAAAPQGHLAWTAPSGPTTFPATYDLVAELAPGRRETCKASLCQTDQLTRLWWSDDGKRVRFTRREGWANSETAIYEWLPGSRNIRRVYRTGDQLADCVPRGADLLCFRDRSNQPRHLALLGLDGTREKTLFQTNPEYSTLTMGRVERQEWRSTMGLPFYADLVYPADYEPGRRYPMVVVQYRTRGFLRGGVGDEMPIQAFANRGYFVLVFDIGDEAAMVGPQTSDTAQQAALNRDHLALKHVLSGLETVTLSLIEKGLVDRDRIGIHGLSAGSTTVQFAALNSSLFSAGSVSSCCWESDQDAFLGPAIADAYHQQGWPKLIDRAPDFWSRISYMREARNVKFPILLQAADRELVGALGPMTALSQAGVPSDVFVFPDEYHLKWHPAHRLAIYRRNLAWFDFWLKGHLPEDPAQRNEAERWAEMRKTWKSEAPGNPERVHR